MTGPADVHRRLEAIGARPTDARAFAAAAARGWAEWAEPIALDLAAALARAGHVAVGRDRTLVAGDFGAISRVAGPQAQFAEWLGARRPYPAVPDAPSPLTCGPHSLQFGHKTYVVAIVNRTPDSFSDGTGSVPPVDRAASAAWAAYRAGADIVDLGAESSEERDHGGITADLEAERLLPLLSELRDLPALISVDCRHASVVERALALRPVLINDVDALADPGLRVTAARSGAPVVLMHDGAIPPGEDPVRVVAGRLLAAVARAMEAGVAAAQIIVDAGFGFGTTLEEDLTVTARLAELRALGRPLLHAPSRKRTIGRVLAFPDTIPERVPGTAAAVAVGIARGADLIRVHDVAEMARVARMTDALVRGAAWGDIVAP